MITGQDLSSVEHASRRELAKASGTAKSTATVDVRRGAWMSTSGARAGLAMHRFGRVLAFIEEHLAEEITVSRLATTVHMSACHFARMFRKAAGEPPHTYLTRRRMKRAKELLRNTDLPLVEVAANSGFQTQGHFTEVFHKHAGVTPRTYRVANRLRMPAR
jgi:AraC-like DNA-binding protein